jgi:hypothetical protein
MTIEMVPVRSALLLLHLSDIHFREPYCLNLETDQDHPVRQAMLYDIRTMVDRLGPVDAILVSGDIAFKGHPQEYQVAAEWLSAVTRVAGCREIDIYTVPGNHDVDRTIAGGRMVQGVRGLIFRHPPGPRRDKELHDTFLDEKTGIELLMPMAEYNLFAASFECDLTPKLPFWIQELPLAPGWKLKMHGLTTTYLSGPDDDVKGELYLGALQRAFAPCDGVVRLAMLHHPPEWLGDHDELDDALWNYCTLHLLGHKHRQRYRTGTQGVRLATGAVNPDRTEGNWEPGYNLTKLQVVEDSTQYFLKIESYLRIWQDNPDRFVAKRTEDDGDIFVHTVPLRRRPSPIPATNAEEVSLMEGNTNKSGTPGGATEAPVNITSPRDLVFDFWKLSPSQRRKIMQSIDLLEPSDDQLPEPQRYRLAFERAREHGVIDKLEDAVSQTLTK